MSRLGEGVIIMVTDDFFLLKFATVGDTNICLLIKIINMNQIDHKQIKES